MMTRLRGAGYDVTFSDGGTIDYDDVSGTFHVLEPISAMDVSGGTLADGTDVHAYIYESTDQATQATSEYGVATAGDDNMSQQSDERLWIVSSKKHDAMTPRDLQHLVVLAEGS